MKKWIPNLNNVLKILSVTSLIFVSTYFGVVQQPTEMGLAILTGALGLAFANLDKFSEFSGAGFSAKMKSQMQAVIDKETEETPSESELNAVSSELSNDEKSLITALANAKYTWRTLPGLCKDSNLSESEAWKILVRLVENEYVRIGNKNKTGEVIWTLTNKGRKVSSK
ncbi:hypothetical protein [Neptunomonas sp.]|uniref:hypothetical protein n=1 Tax=Neptunomonas sp. TaxID=1971898 RepID=UPI0035633C3A